MDPRWIKLLLLARLVAYMALFYVAFGLLVEHFSRKPESKLKAFARLLVSPLTRAIGATAPAETPYPVLLRRAAIAVGVLWLALLAASELALSSTR